MVGRGGVARDAAAADAEADAPSAGCLRPGRRQASRSQGRVTGAAVVRLSRCKHGGLGGKRRLKLIWCAILDCPQIWGWHGVQRRRGAV